MHVLFLNIKMLCQQILNQIKIKNFKSRVKEAEACAKIGFNSLFAVYKSYKRSKYIENQVNLSLEYFRFMAFSSYYCLQFCLGSRGKKTVRIVTCQFPNDIHDFMLFFFWVVFFSLLYFTIVCRMSHCCMLKNDINFPVSF